MSSPLDARTLVAESLPAAAVLLLWAVPSVLATWFDLGSLSLGFTLAGAVMAGLYVVVRGAALARTVPLSPAPMDVEGVLRENGRVLLPAGVWFLVAALVFLVEAVWRALPIGGLFTSPADPLAFAFVETGVATVLLYAVAVGLPRVRGEAPTPASASGDGTDAAAPND